MKPEIVYHTHHSIDKAKWNALISASPNGLIYAHTDFLDAMSPGWNALIAGDYAAVMPLTWRKKMGIKYLCQPAFCQQLGVFSGELIQPPLVEAFMHSAVLHFRLIEIFLNETNHTDSVRSQATNYVLSLRKPYQVLHNAYRRDLLNNLKRSEKFPLEYIASDNADHAIEQYRMMYGKRLDYRNRDFDSFRLLCQKWIHEGKCLVREVQLQDRLITQPLAIGLFLKDQKRLYNIASTTLPNGRTLEANHFLFDRLIREFAGQDLLLDFEGSDLPGVARFYQKFQPVNRPFFFWKNNRLPALLRMWKR